MIVIIKIKVDKENKQVNITYAKKFLLLSFSRKAVILSNLPKKYLCENI